MYYLCMVLCAVISCDISVDRGGLVGGEVVCAVCVERSCGVDCETANGERDREGAVGNGWPLLDSSECSGCVGGNDSL